jgi:hypothetical protein
MLITGLTISVLTAASPEIKAPTATVLTVWPIARGYRTLPSRKAS